METSRQVSPSPIKIQHESYTERLACSFTVYPADGCSNEVVKQCKPRERTASSGSETSDPLLGGDMVTTADEDAGEEELEGLVREKKSVETTAQSFKMQSHLRDMQRRVEVLQGLMQESAQQGSLRSHFEGAATQANSCLAIVERMEKSNNEVQLADHQTLVPKESGKKLLGPTSTLPSMCAEIARNDDVSDSRDGQTDSSLTSTDEENPFAITALVKRIKALQVQLKEATTENKQLQNTVRKLEQENARFQAQTAVNTPVCGGDDGGMTSSQSSMELNAAVDNDIGYNSDRRTSHLATAIFGASSSFQIVMKEDLKILKNHERCQHKLHELWDSVRQLKLFVETYQIERNDMRLQRDDAIAEAERADVENIRLMSSNNPLQKIKYLQQMKSDNEALRRKNRALNERIVKEAIKLVREKNGCSVREGGDVTIETVKSALLEDTLQDFDEPSDRNGEEILRRMWNFSRLLEQRLDRLRLARQNLPQDDDESSETSEFVGQMSVISEPSGYLCRYFIK